MNKKEFTKEKKVKVEGEKLGFTDDFDGDSSAKRLAGFILLGSSIALGLFLSILGSFHSIASPDIALVVFKGFLWGSFGAFSLTVPEAVTDIVTERKELKNESERDTKWIN